MATQTAAEPTARPLTAPLAASAPRYLALDAYRGLIMIVLVSGGFGFGALQNDPVWKGVAAQFEHVPWEGLGFWDLILPAFFFMVGAAMPYAFARRIEQGATFPQNLRHTAVRSLKLLALSLVLVSAPAGQLRLPVMSVLFHMAFTYFFCFLIMQLKFRWQAVCAALILAGHLALYLLFPGPGGPFSMTGNIGAVLDHAILGMNHPGYYVSFNIVPGTLSTLFGVWAALLLRSPRSQAQKLKILAGAAVAALAAGLALSPFVPVVKRIYTASYTLYSAGWVLLMMLAFVWIIDVKGYRKWTFPLVVVGMNCIFVYSLSQMLGGWLRRAVGAFTGNFVFIGTLAPVAQRCATLLVIWYLCYWLYQRKLFLKL